MSLMFITCMLHCCTSVTLNTAPVAHDKRGDSSTMAPTLEWTDQDEKARHAAITHCREASSDQQCLTKFKRVEPSIYTAICGKNNN